MYIRRLHSTSTKSYSNQSALELLAPAKTADIGIEAIRHGADAVYIGAPQFGARQAAGNSLEDIQRLVEYAHQFEAKIYVTVNTIFFDSELAQVEQMIRELYELGVDALIVQDMSLKKMDLPPIPLHGSTQMDNRTPEKVRFLSEQGFEQVVLARELSLEEIRAIHEANPQTKLEVFVHGALCVSLSGQCYASEAIFGRSANRGECAQICRMEFDLEDEKGNILLHKKHLLSLKDLCQIDALEDLAEAGASSFKIEGRLKDAAYVKNVTAAYSQALDVLVAKHPDKYRRASKGRVELKFQPDVRKSFNRGFTHYFLYGRNADIFSFDTPKALGEPVGRVKEVYTDSFVVNSKVQFANGDGLCFFDKAGKLYGFRINKAIGERLYPLEMPRMLRRGNQIYRNYDKRFDDILAHESAERYIPVDVTIDRIGEEFVLTMTDGEYTAELHVPYEAELARTHQSENIERQFSKLGNTPFRLRSFRILYKKNYFIPSSLLTEWRRTIVEKMKNEECRMKNENDSSSLHSSRSTLHDNLSLTYLGNVSNHLSRSFYQDRGFQHIEPAFELSHQQGVPVMFCKHCIRYALGWCYKRQNFMTDVPSQLFLRLENGKRFALEFDCKACMMKVIY